MMKIYLMNIPPASHIVVIIKYSVSTVYALFSMLLAAVHTHHTTCGSEVLFHSVTKAIALLDYVLYFQCV